MTTTDRHTTPAESRARPVTRVTVNDPPMYSTDPPAEVPVSFHASSNGSALPPSPRVVAAAAEAVARGNRYPVIGGAVRETLAGP